MSDTYGGISFVDVLATGARGAKGVHANVALADRAHRYLVRLRHHGHGASRGVDTPLRLCLGNPLHPVRTGFEFEVGVHIAPFDKADDFLEATVLARTLGENLDFPAHGFRIAAVHAKQVTRENCRFVTARARANLQEHVARVLRVAGQQQRLQFPLQRLKTFATTADFLFRHGHEVGIGFLQHAARLVEVRAHTAVVVVTAYHLFQLREFARQLPKAVLVGDGLGIAEQCRYLLVAIGEGIQFGQQGSFHCRVRSTRDWACDVTGNVASPSAGSSVPALWLAGPAPSSPNSRRAPARRSCRPSALARLRPAVGA